MSAGTYYAAFYETSTGCYTATAEVKVSGPTPPTVAPINGTDKPCSAPTSSTYTYTNSTTGGVWSVSPTTVASIDPGTGVLTTVAGANGTATITYTVGTGSSCTGTATFNVTVSPTDCVPMPVTLISFTVKKSETGSSRLEWKTAEETNSEKFDIEHSNNGKTWNLISTVAAKGESKQTANYHYIHTTPSNGENLYRLKMVDLDGTFAYSRIVSVTVNEGLQISIFPNPAANAIKVKAKGITNWNEIQDVRIYDLNGKTIYTSQKLPSGEINVSQMGAGTYVISINGKNGQIHSTKFVIAK